MALKRKTLFYYGLADLPVSMSLFPVLVFLPKFYTSEMAVRYPDGQHDRRCQPDGDGHFTRIKLG